MEEFSTIVDILHNRALNQPNKTAYIFLADGESREIRLTFEELDRKSQHIAAHLKSEGVTGERVLLLYPSGLEFISSLLGCMYAGVVPIPLYPPRRNGSLSHLRATITDACPKAVLTTRTILNGVTHRSSGSREFLVMPWIVTDCIRNDSDRMPEWHGASLDGNTLALLQYTSGSTGAPKGVMVSHANLIHNLKMLRTGLETTNSTSFCSWLPLFHDMGLIGNVLHSLYLGAPCILMSPMSFLQKPFRWLQAISRHRINYSGGPNFAYDLCVEKISQEQRKTLDLSSWTLAFNGAEPIRAGTLQRFTDVFQTCGFRPESFYPCYGMAEATLLISGGTKTASPTIQYVEKAALKENRVIETHRDHMDPQAIVECGQTWLDQKIIIVDPESLTQCPSGVVGEIWVSGPSVAQGYWNQPEETESTFRANLTDSGEGPFLRTGDLGSLKDGKLLVTGRLKDLIIIRGRNYYPQDIELTVEQSHPALLSGCGAALSVDIGNEECLVIVYEVKRTHIRNLKVEEIIQDILHAVIAHHEIQVHAIQLLRTSSIPRTSSGKIQRRACLAGYLNKSLSIVGEWQYCSEDSDLNGSAEEIIGDLRSPLPLKTHTAEVVRAWLMVRIARHLRITPQSMDVARSFSHYGIDSKDMAGLSFELEEWLGRELSPTLLYDYPTIEILAQYLAGKPEPGNGSPSVQTGSRNAVEPIAIIGMGCRFPGAKDPEAFWRLLHDGIDIITEFPSDRKRFYAFYDPDPYAPGKTYSRFGGFLEGVDEFDPFFFGISPREAASLDPQQRLLLEVSWETIERAGIAPDSLHGSPTGVFVGIGSFDYAATMMRELDPERTDAYSGSGGSLSMAAGRISYTLGLTGPSMAIDTACSSSLVAVHQACQSLRCSESNLAIAGGVNLILNPATMVILSKARMLSEDGRCKAFDAMADGYVRSEGCGIILLKRLSDALAEGDTILALIRGSAVNQDGPSAALTVPNGVSQEKVIRQALISGGIVPSQVSHVEAHGTGTSLGDPIEMEALGKVFGKDPSRDQSLIVGSSKTNVGHGEAVSGAIGLMKVVLSLLKEEIPPHLHFNHPNPQIDWGEMQVKIPTEAVPWPSSEKRRIAGVSAFGFSGTNAHVVLEEAPKSTPVCAEEERPLHLLALSAKTENALTQLAEEYENHLEENPSLDIGDICFTANTGRSHFTDRLSILAASSSDLRDRLSRFRKGQKSQGVFQRKASGADRPLVAFLCTGQGSQRIGMGIELFKTQPTFRHAMELCGEILRPSLEIPLLEILYPENSEDSPIDETVYTQPALFALEYSLAELWISWGIKPDIVMGHSVGEYVAACLAGVFSLEDGLNLIAARARMMQALPRNGEMVAVMADESKVARAIQPFATKVSIAAVNGQQNVVVSGDRQAVHMVVNALEEERIKTRTLKVSHAFHSPLMEPMMKEFQRCAAAVTYAEPRIDIISNVTGGCVSLEMTDPDYWCRHIRMPVRFVDSMRALHQRGYGLFVEIGPQPTLLGMGRQCIPGGEGVWLPSLRKHQWDWRQILQSLGDMYVQGISVDWSGFDRDYARDRVELPTYPFQRQRYWYEMDEGVSRKITPARIGDTNDFTHPLLGRRVHSAVLGDQGIQFESRISSTSPEFLDHHRFSDTVIVPAAVYSEMALAAGIEFYEKGNLILGDVAISENLILPDNEERTVQLILTNQGAAASFFQIFSRDTNCESKENSWVLHASGNIFAGHDDIEVPQADLCFLRDRIKNEISVEEYNQTREGDGVDYCPCFHTVDRLWMGESEALCRIRVPKQVAMDYKHYRLHPVLVDVCFQVFSCLIPSDCRKDLYLQTSCDRLHAYQRPGTRLWCHVRKRAAETGKQPKTFTGDLCLFDENGDIVVRIEGHAVSRVSPQALLTDSQNHMQNSLYELDWHSQENQTVEMNLRAVERKPERWLIFADSLGTGEKLATILRKDGDECLLVFPGEEYEQLSNEEFRMDPINSEHFELLMAVLGRDESPLNGIVHLWSLNAARPENLSKDDLETASRRGCGSLLHLIQSLVISGFSETCRLYIVTRGAVQVGGDTNVPGLAQSPIWGMGRVIALEHPEFHCRYLDLDPSGDAKEAQRVCDEMRSADREDQIAFRQGIRHIPRIRKGTLQEQEARNRLQIPRNTPFQLSIANYGILDGIAVKSMMRHQPGPGEVEVQVRAAGLNFRDLLNALGMLQEYTDRSGSELPIGSPLGFECAGNIVAVGEDVSNLKIGDKVMAALALGSLGSFVTVNAEFVIPKPEKLSYEEVVTIPIAFLTAHYGLNRLSQLGPGDRVLIHSAAGGVGLAAVQLVQRAGAEVFATASPGKWEFLQSLGVEHIMNSRTLKFADEIMAITKGRGVDVLLNSLNGEFIPKNLRVLGKGGRFVEIGKIGIWDQDKMHKLRPDISYFPFDLLEVASNDPGLIGIMLGELKQGLEEGNLKPLPHKVFRMQDTISAFRYMQRAKHIGKIVISQHERRDDSSSPEPVMFHSDSTYLITGGLGSLGLQVAQWMAGNGAKHLVLAGRGGNRDHVSNQMREIEQAGAEIVVAKADVSDAGQVERMLRDIEKSLPPLRGIIHAAGILDDGILIQSSWDRFSRVMVPKVEGAWNLHTLTLGTHLDFFVLFSSIASFLGSPGQGNYAAANAFMDALSHYRHTMRLPGLSINWGPWSDVGMAADLNDRDRRRMGSAGIEMIAPDRALRMLGDLIRQDAAQIAVQPVNWKKVLNGFQIGDIPPVLSDLASHRAERRQQPAKENELLRQLCEASSSSRESLLSRYIQDEVSKIMCLGDSHIDIQQPLDEVGIDSLMAVELRLCIKFGLGMELPMENVLDGSSISDLVRVLSEQFTGDLSTATPFLLDADEMIEGQL